MKRDLLIQVSENGRGEMYFNPGTSAEFSEYLCSMCVGLLLDHFEDKDGMIPPGYYVVKTEIRKARKKRG